MNFDPAKVLRHSLVLLSGDESALRRSALDDLLACAEVQKDDFDLQFFEGDSDPIDWLAAAGTAPFLASRRTVVVRHVLRREPDEDLHWALPDHALLILIADDEQGDDDKQKRLRRVQVAWEKLVANAGGSVVDCKACAGDFSKRVNAELAKSGKKLSGPALTALVEMCGGSVSRGIEESAKLALYATDSQIQEADVRAIVVPSREWSVYKIVDAIVGGDAGEALRQLRILVGSATKAEEAAFRQIFPQISRNLRLLWQARACLDAGAQADAANSSVGLLDKPNLAKEKDFSRNKVFRIARRLRQDQIAHLLQIASDADAAMKGLAPSFSAMETLEQMVLKMADVCSQKLAGSKA